MKNVSEFIVELVVTIIVAGLLTGILDVVLLFVAGNLSIYNQPAPSINALSGAIFGLIVGYKLNTLVREHKS